MPVEMLARGGEEELVIHQLGVTEVGRVQGGRGRRWPLLRKNWRAAHGAQRLPELRNTAIAQVMAASQSTGSHINVVLETDGALHLVDHAKKKARYLSLERL